MKLKFRTLLDLKENNLICGFTYHSLYIIDINYASIISKFIFHNTTKKEQNITEDKEIEENEEDENYEDEDDINNGDALHDGSQPFILKNPKSNNYFLCFKQVSYYTIFEYKKSKIIKKVNIEKKLCFEIYKPKDVYNYFFVILLSEEGFIQVQKVDNNVKIVEIFKTSFKFPYPKELSDERSEYTDPNIEDNGIYRCIINDINNFYFIYQSYNGSPFEKEVYYLFECKNGKRIKKRK